MENRRILVIEDDPDILEILDYNLSKKPYWYEMPGLTITW